MKLYGKIFFAASLLTLLVSCGKENKSGTSSYNYTNPYCTTAYGCTSNYYNSGAIGVYNSPYAILTTAQQQNPCVAGSYYANTRIPIQTQIQLNTYTTAGEVYVGVTSYGDVAGIIGQGGNTALLVAYVCPRSATSGTGSIVAGPSLGTYTRCTSGTKPITALTLRFPDGLTAAFRDPYYGTSSNGRFSFCP